MAPPDYEAKWRERWEAEGVGRIADLDAVAAGDVFYNLVEFPYPSASGLHVGHVFKYSGADAYGRYQRMRGKAVFLHVQGVFRQPDLLGELVDHSGEVVEGVTEFVVRRH